ncbi:hypothetical protein A2U01_0008814, partial [Trifolium medium]|nr:hypothetical protein [Trifolium medium]
VRRRGRKGCREDGRGRDRSRQTRQRYYSRSISTPRYQGFIDQQTFPDQGTWDRHRSRRHQSLYSREQRVFARHGNLHNRRLASANSYRSRSPSVRGRRLQQRDYEHQGFRQREHQDLSQQRYKTRSRFAQHRWRQNNQGDRRFTEAVEDGSRLHGRNFDRRRAEIVVGGERIEGGKDKVGVRGMGHVDGGVVSAGLKHRDDNVSGSDLKRYVSFYFTNFPAQLSKFYLRKGFEVCGMLEDVYVAKKRNKYGQPYGFVKFSNVKNVSKMTNALNDVCFGHYRVRASVAMFERNDSGAGGRMETQKIELEQADVPSSKDGKQASTRPEGSKNERQTQSEGVSAPRAEKVSTAPMEGVRVGDIVVELKERKVSLAQKKAQTEGDVLLSKEVELPVDTVKEGRVLMKSYRTKSDDAEWACNGLVATVYNGEAISVVQNRIVDAGFKDLVLIPMGADKVFVRSSEGVDAMVTVNNAKEFFQLLFSNWMRWEMDALPYRRGAWVRLYGIPLHAWNEQFFKLCVFECGSFL